ELRPRQGRGSGDRARGAAAGARARPRGRVQALPGAAEEERRGPCLRAVRGGGALAGDGAAVFAELVAGDPRGVLPDRAERGEAGGEGMTQQTLRNARAHVMWLLSHVLEEEASRRLVQVLHALDELAAPPAPPVDL